MNIKIFGLLMLLIMLAGCAKEQPVQEVKINISRPYVNMSAFEGQKFESFNIFSTRLIENNTLHDAITSDTHVEKNYEELFSELLTWLGFAQSSSKEVCSTENNKWRCLYYYSIRTGRDDLCAYLKADAVWEECRQNGCRNITIDYKDLCTTRALLMQEYLTSENKTEFCRSFKENNTANSCLIYYQYSK